MYNPNKTSDLVGIPPPFILPAAAVYSLHQSRASSSTFPQTTHCHPLPAFFTLSRERAPHHTLRQPLPPCSNSACAGSCRAPSLTGPFQFTPSCFQPRRQGANNRHSNAQLLMPAPCSSRYLCATLPILPVMRPNRPPALHIRSHMRRFFYRGQEAQRHDPAPVNNTIFSTPS